MTKDCLYCGNPIVSKRSTKKYCSNNCKQLAFYKRTQLQLTAPSGTSDLLYTGTTKSVNYGSEDITDDESLNVNQTLNDNISIDQWEKSYKDSTLLPKSPPLGKPLTVKSFTPDPQTDYQWVESSFMAKIAGYIDESQDMLLIQNPHDYWGTYYLPIVKWVSQRLRCLLENLIRLNNYPSIDYATLATVKDAFTDLTGSDNFKRLPSNYPNTGFIKELQQKLSVIVKQHKPREHIRFRLTQKLKVEIIAKRFMMADFIPAAKFHDLDFEK